MDHIKNLLSSYWAKSDGTTIREHTDKLLENLQILKQSYKEHIERVIPSDMSKDKFWEILKLACEYHDYGKLHAWFQKKVGNSKIKINKNLPEVRHNLLSLAFVRSEDEFIKRIVRLLVLHHHTVKNEDYEKVKKVLQEEFNVNINLKLIITKSEENYLKDQIAGELGLNYDSLLVYYRLLKGLLLRLDHSSSSKQSDQVEDRPIEDTCKFVEKHFKLNDLQESVKNKREKNLVVIAPTGSGKTEAGVIYLKNKGFFILPYRVSANSIYERIKKMIGDYCGLLHSSAINYILGRENIDEDIYNNKKEGIFQNYYSAKNLAKPITVCTPDQLFHFVFSYCGFEKYYATCLYSRLVLDEIQSYDPITLAFITFGLSKIAEGGGRFMVMTATFPKFLEKYFPNAEFKRFDLQKKPYHNVKIKESSIMDALGDIAELSKNAKVLVVVNTVKRAQEIYQELRFLGAKVLHSRFILRDRIEKERLIKEFFDGGSKGVWITTQLAEVSLDLDADYLFTELSTADSLIQRMGRCNRRGEKPTNQPNVFVFTEDCSGIGRVYYKNLFENTKKNLKEGLWDWNTKWELMDKVYSEEAINETKYKEKYDEAYNYISSVWEVGQYLVDKKSQAQELFRDIDAVMVIPETFRDKTENLVEKWQNSKSMKEKINILNTIHKYTFSLPWYYVSKSGYEPLPQLDIYYIKGRYDPELGFEIPKEKDPELEDTII